MMYPPIFENGEWSFSAEQEKWLFVFINSFKSGKIIIADFLFCNYFPGKNPARTFFPNGTYNENNLNGLQNIHS